MPTTDPRALLFCLLSVFSAAAHAQGGFSLMTPDRLWDLYQVGSPIVSPDGEKIVFTVSRQVHGSPKIQTNLWLVDVDGAKSPRQLTRSLQADFDPAWSPDSREIVYASIRGGQPPQAFILNLGGGEARQVTRFPTGISNPRFAPEGRRLFFQAVTYADVNDDLERLEIRLAGQNRELIESYVTDGYVSVIEGTPLPLDRVSHVFEIGVDGDGLRDLTPGLDSSAAVSDFYWDLSADAGALVVSAPDSRFPDTTIDHTLHLIDVETRTRKEITPDLSGSAFDPMFTAEGQILFGRRLTPEAFHEHVRLFRYTPEDGTFNELYSGEEVSPEQWLATPTGSVYFTAQQRGKRNVYRIGRQGGKARIVVEGGSITDLQFLPDGQLVFRRETMSQPPELVTTDADGNHMRQLTFLNQPLLEQTRIGSVREVEFSGAEGDPIHGFMVLPPGFHPNRIWPSIVLLHGGPHRAWLDRFNLRWNYLTFASWGYVVIAINVHGSTGYGEAFAASVNGRALDLGQEDAISAARYLSTLSYVDRERVAVIGGSYGGFLVNSLIGKKHNFCAMVSHAGVADALLQFSSDHPWTRKITYGGSPTAPPEQTYRALSPARQIDQDAAPALFLHGMLDTRVPHQHSILMHNLLREANVRSRLVLLPHTGHQLNDRVAAGHWWSEIQRWLQSECGPTTR